MALGRLAICLLLSFAFSTALPAGQPAAKNKKGPLPPKTPQAWTAKEALAQWARNRHDPYLQYVALQLARAEKLPPEQIPRLVSGMDGGAGHELNLLSLFGGSAAVQEALQLDTLMPEGTRGTGPGLQTSPMVDPSTPIVDPYMPKPEAASPKPEVARPKPAPGVRAKPRAAAGPVKISGLEGPKAKSHPWEELLKKAAKPPEVSPLARCVPADQWMVLARRPSKLLEVVETGGLWQQYLAVQASPTATDAKTTERCETQLAIRTTPALAPLYDAAVAEVAVTGSDLFLGMGSDVTVLFAVKQPEVFRRQMDAFLAEAERSQPGARRTTGKLAGVEFVHVAAPDRRVHVYSCWPRPDLHVRSNSQPALERVLAVIAGASPGAKPAASLGQSAEYRYIRALLPRGDAREDVLVYLSDPFIRRLLGPRVFLTQLRRLETLGHLRMISHASMLYRTQFGRRPKTLSALAEGGCTPGIFGQGKLRCPLGGTYALSDDGAAGVSSVAGRAGRMVPCCEIRLDEVTAEEAKGYTEFVKSYNDYWRTYFDPIALRIEANPEQYRVETLVLPLIDNSIYTALAAALGGRPQPMVSLPAPPQEFASLAFAWDRKKAVEGFESLWKETTESDKKKLPFTHDEVTQLLSKGIGSQVSLHVYDFSLPVGINLLDVPGYFQTFGMGWGMALFGQVQPGPTVPARPAPKVDPYATPLAPPQPPSAAPGENAPPPPSGTVDAAWLGFVGGFYLYGSFLCPMYAAVPVDDAAVVDRFLEKLDAVVSKGLTELASGQDVGSFGYSYVLDFYTAPLPGCDTRLRCVAAWIGPIRLRLFYARIGRGLYFTSRPQVLADLVQAEREHCRAKTDKGEPQAGPAASAALRVRLDHAPLMRTAIGLREAENNRRAALGNLEPLAAVARALVAERQKPPAMDDVLREAAALYGEQFTTPDGTRYVLSPDGRTVTSTVHGSPGVSRQTPLADAPQGARGFTAELSFPPEGLRAVLTIRREK